MSARSTRLLMLSWVGAYLCVATGCGPVQSTSYLIDTETMLEAAKTAQADRNAPYEYTAASLYYAKSKEEVGYSDYEQAIDYAKKALDFATRARDGAVRAARKAANETPVSAPPVVAP